MVFLLSFCFFWLAPLSVPSWETMLALAGGSAAAALNLLVTVGDAEPLAWPSESTYKRESRQYSGPQKKRKDQGIPTEHLC